MDNSGDGGNCGLAFPHRRKILESTEKVLDNG
jgi:hypothetical protein